jgi:TRAP-type C4-dicarboxylate transport system permease small subunit
MNGVLARWALRPAALLGGVILASLVPLTVLDVVLRYALNAPLRGTFELTELAMVAVVFLALGEAQARSEHITIDLVHDRIGDRGRVLVRRFARVLSLVATVAIAWQLALYAGRVRAAHEVSGVLGVPLHLAVGVAVAGFALFALAVVIDA